MTPAAARLTWRFALLPALSVVVLTGLMLAFEHRLLDTDLTERGLLRNQQRADVLGLQLQSALRDAVHQVRLQARSPLMQPGVPSARMRTELDKLVTESPRFAWVGLVSLDGQVLAGSRGWLEGRSIATRPVFQQGQNGMVGDVHAAVALAPLLAKLPGSPTELIDIGEPVRDDDGRVVAVVTAHLGLSWVNDVMAFSLGEPAVASQLGLTGLVMTDPDNRSVVQGMAVPRGLPRDIPTARLWSSEEGVRYLIAQAPLRGQIGDAPLLGWRAVVLQREDVVLSLVDKLSASMMRIGGIAALGLAVAGIVVSRRMLTPWRPMFDAVLASENPADHAGVAARVLALVARRGEPTPVERLMGWLARDAGNLRRAIDHLPVAIGLLDSGYRVEYVNPAFTRLLGWTTEHTRGQLAGECLIDPIEHDALQRMYEQLGDPPGEFASRLDALTPGDKRVAVQWHVVPMFGAQGDRVGALAIVYDIRAERHAQARAEAMTGRLRALTDAALDTLLATLDIDGRVIEWSAGAEQLSGCAAAQAIGKPLSAVLPCRQQDGAWLRQALIEKHCSINMEMRLSHGTRWFEGSIYALGLAPGSARFGVILRDATEQHLARKGITDSEAKLSAIINNASDAIISVNTQGSITLFNPSAERIFGHSAAQLLGSPLDVLLPAVARRNHGIALEEFAQSGLNQRAMGAGRVQGQHADGRTLQLEGSLSRAATNGQTVLTAILRDVTERVSQEALLERTRRELARFNHRLLELERQTSRQLALALHDELGQTLAALRLHWEAHASADAIQQANLNERIVQLVALANRQVRSVLAELRPPLLDEQGLAAALDNEVRQHRPTLGANDSGEAAVVLQTTNAQAQRWPDDVEYAAFMIAREALVNALRHASAQHIIVSLNGDADQLQMSIQDDGIGIDSDVSGTKFTDHGGPLGLVSMRERALAIGAQLHIDAPPGHGTMVTLTWEVSTEAHDDEPYLPDR